MSIPGMSPHADTRKSTIVCTRDYINQLQSREKRLRAILMKSLEREERYRRALGPQWDAVQAECADDTNIDSKQLESLGEQVEKMVEALAASEPLEPRFEEQRGGANEDQTDDHERKPSLPARLEIPDLRADVPQSASSSSFSTPYGLPRRESGIWTGTPLASMPGSYGLSQPSEQVVPLKRESDFPHDHYARYGPPG